MEMTGIIILAIMLMATIIGFTLFLFQMMHHLNRNMQDLSKTLRDRLEATHKTVGDRLDSASRLVSDVREHLGRLSESNKRIFEIGKDISSLQDLLRAPKIRGGLGELFLGDLLSQIMPRDFFSIQYEFKSKERVDAVIRFGNGLVPVDAKFPLENFKKYFEKSDEQEKRNARKQFMNDVKMHIKTIATKYILPEEGTFDFALMYIPAENIYYEAIIKDESFSDEQGLFQYALKHKVVPVSPNSFYAYLRVILLGLKGMAIEKSVKDIIASLAQLKGNFDKFHVEFEKLGRHLSNSKTSYDESEKRLDKFQDQLVQLDTPKLDTPKQDTPKGIAQE